MALHKTPFSNEEAAVDGLAKGIFRDKSKAIKDLSQISLPSQKGLKRGAIWKKEKNFQVPLFSLQNRPKVTFLRRGCTPSLRMPRDLCATVRVGNRTLSIRQCKGDADRVRDGAKGVP